MHPFKKTCADLLHCVKREQMAEAYIRRPLRWALIVPKASDCGVHKLRWAFAVYQAALPSHFWWLQGGETVSIGVRKRKKGWIPGHIKNAFSP